MSLDRNSVRTYLNEIAPTIGPRQIAILEVFEKNPERDYSNSELTEMLGWKINQVTGRVKELRELGILELGRERPCFQTGRTVSAWRLKAVPAISPRAIPVGKAFYQLPSQTVPTGRHVIKSSAAGMACSCRGYYYRKTCSHVKHLSKHKSLAEVMRPLF